MNKFEELLTQLANHEIDEFDVSREEFMEFRQAWSAREDRKHIVGEAHLGGAVTYHWEDTPL